jgi:enoyl-CoA hydratase/carnithine racemase
MGNVQHTAHHLATMVSPRSVAVMKQQVRKTYFQSFGDSLAEADAAMEESFTTFDFKEGVASFVERRTAQFKGR